MSFEWDPAKAASNHKKHSVRFADATSVFFDDRAVTLPDEDQDEERFVTLGKDAIDRVLVVVYRWRGDHIRIISARRATRRERQEYEGET